MFYSLRLLLSSTDHFQWRLLVGITILCLIASSPCASANDPGAYSIQDLLDRKIISPLLSYSIDASSKAGIDEMLQLDSKSWISNAKGKQNFGQLSVPIWFKFSLKDVLSANEPLFLELSYPHHDYLNLYIVAGSEVLRSYQTGDLRSFASRGISHPDFVFPIPDSKDHIEVYFSVHTEGILQIPIMLMTQSEFDRKKTGFTFFSGLYFGAIMIMLIYNSFIYLTVKDQSYLYYLAFITASALLQLTFSGLAFMYLWPDLAYINHYAIIVSAALVTICAIRFMQRFVGIDRIASPVDYIWMELLIGAFALVLISSLLLSYSYALKATYVVAGLTIITGFYIGLKYWRKGYKAARFFTFAWFIYLIFIGLYILDSHQVIEPNIISENAFSLGSLIELSLLSIAFADKLNEEKELRVNVQDELLVTQLRMNDKLDSLVESRTAELEEANAKLQQLSVTDGLTQLKNRYYFDFAYKREFQRAARENWPFSVIMIDIDNFKKLNDEHGHLFGDYCLGKSAQLIQSVIRRPSDTVARYGGEEIAVLLPNTPLDGAIRLAEIIREQFRETEFVTSGIHQYLTVSIGVACGEPLPEMQDNQLALLELADQCLYKAKRNGRDQVVGQKLTV